MVRVGGLRLRDCNRGGQGEQGKRKAGAGDVHYRFLFCWYGRQPIINPRSCHCRDIRAFIQIKASELKRGGARRYGEPRF
jgi:hypothetical protein